MMCVCSQVNCAERALGQWYVERGMRAARARIRRAKKAGYKWVPQSTPENLAENKNTELFMDSTGHKHFLDAGKTMPTKIRFSTFPRTEPPPEYLQSIMEVFGKHEKTICTLDLEKGLTSDAVLKVLRADLVGLGFLVEESKTAAHKLKRPVFFGENGTASLQYEIDGYHPQWRCGFEIEAGRAWMGNAVYRDLIQALVWLI
jgi:hypothetical protein